MTRDFFENYAKTVHEKLTGMGASFKFTIANPEEVFLKNGYKLTEEVSIAEKAVLFEAPDLPAAVWETVQPTLPHGYLIYVFESE